MVDVDAALEQSTFDLRQRQRIRMDSITASWVTSGGLVK